MSLFYRRPKRHRYIIPVCLTRRYDYPHWLELSISRINFHGPKGVRAIAGPLYLDLICPGELDFKNTTSVNFSRTVYYLLELDNLEYFCTKL